MLNNLKKKKEEKKKSEEKKKKKSTSYFQLMIQRTLTKQALCLELMQQITEKKMKFLHQ